MPLDYSLPILAAQSIQLPTPEESQLRQYQIEQLKQARQAQIDNLRDQKAIEDAFRQNVGPDGLPNIHGILSSLSVRPSAYQKVSAAFTKSQKDALDNEKLQNENDAARNTAFSQAVQGLNAGNYEAQAPTLRQMFPERAMVLGPTFNQGAIDAARNAGTHHNDYLATVKQANDLALDNKPTEGAAMQGRALLESGAATPDDVQEWMHKWQMMGVNPALLRNGITDQSIKALEAATLTPEKQAERAAAAAGRTETAAAQKDLENLKQAGAERLQNLRSQGQIRLEQLRQSGRLSGPAGTGGVVPPSALDPNAPHGEDYLKTIPATDQPIVKALAEGRQPWPSSMAMRSPQWTRIMQEVFQYDPTLDLATVNQNTRAKVRQDFTSGKTAQNITALNTAIGHLGTLSQDAERLGNTSMPFVNSVKNWVSTQSGGSAVTNFDTAKKAVADELTRVWRNSSGNEADIQSWQKSLNASQSPEQLHQALATIGDLLESRLSSLENQYRQGMGRVDIPIVTPQSRGVLNQLEGKAPSATAPTPQATGGSVTVVGRDGKTYRFPSQAAADAFKKAGG